MITGSIKTQVDGIWNAFWSGGISNPMEVIEQMTYLLPDSVTFPNHSAPPHFACPVRAECGDVRGA